MLVEFMDWATRLQNLYYKIIPIRLFGICLYLCVGYLQQEHELRTFRPTLPYVEFVAYIKEKAQ